MTPMSNIEKEEKENYVTGAKEETYPSHIGLPFIEKFFLSLSRC